MVSVCPKNQTCATTLGHWLKNKIRATTDAMCEYYENLLDVAWWVILNSLGLFNFQVARILVKVTVEVVSFATASWPVSFHSATAAPSPAFPVSTPRCTPTEIGSSRIARQNSASTQFTWLWLVQLWQLRTISTYCKSITWILEGDKTFYLIKRVIFPKARNRRKWKNVYYVSMLFFYFHIFG